MGKIQARAGDFGTGAVTFTGQGFIMPNREHLPIHMLAGIEPITHASVKKLSSTLIGGIAGAVLFGPLGALAGALLSGNAYESHFISRFNDGRMLVGTTNPTTYMELIGAAGNIQDTTEMHGIFMQHEQAVATVDAEKYATAVKQAYALGETSIRHIQQLGYGFGEAAQIIEKMENAGIVDQPDTNGARRVQGKR